MSDWTYANPFPFASSPLYGGTWGRTTIDVQGQPVQATPARDGESRTRQQTGGLWTPAGYYAPACVPGLNQPPPGDYRIWRAMDLDPALVLSRGVITAPIREAETGTEVREGTKDEWVNLVTETLKPLWPAFLCEALDAISMGWSPFEVVYDRREGKTVFAELKPLLPDTGVTDVLTRDGQTIGLRHAYGRDNKAVDLLGDSAFWVTVGGKKRNPYGCPWHEHGRQSWWDKLHVLANLAKLNKKASGIQGTMYYPPAADEATNHTNEKLAQTLLKQKMQGDGAVLPNAAGMLNADTAADFRNIKGLAAAALWQYQLDDHGNLGPEAKGLLDQLRYHNADLSRAWHVPERSSQEAVTAGSRADSESHADIALTMSQLVFNGICDALSRGPVDTMLVQNYGERARGAVRVVAGKLRDVYADGDWKLIDAVLRQPDLFMAVAEQVDVDAIFTRRGIPKVKSVLTLTDAIRQRRQQLDKERQAQAGMNGTPANGNGRLAMSREDEKRMHEFVEGFAMLGRIGHE